VPLTVRVSVAAACLFLVVYVVKLIVSGRLQLKYSLLWLASVVVLLLSALFPQPLCHLSSKMGFATPSNFIFILGFVFAILIMLSLSLIASKQADAIKNLTQRLALLEKDFEHIQKDQ